MERPVVTRKVRIVPVSKHPRMVCLRVELIGCQSEGFKEISNNKVPYLETGGEKTDDENLVKENDIVISVDSNLTLNQQKKKFYEDKTATDITEPKSDNPTVDSVDYPADNNLDHYYLALAVCVLVIVIVILIVAILVILYKNYKQQSRNYQKQAERNQQDQSWKCSQTGQTFTQPVQESYPLYSTYQNSTLNTYPYKYTNHS